MITTVQCSICSQLNNKSRVVVTEFRLHHTCGIIILWLHLLTGVIRSLLCNPHAFSSGIIGASLSEPLFDELAGAFLWYIYIYEKHFLNEQKSRDAAVKKYRYKRSRDK